MNSLIQRLLVARTTGHAPPGLIDEVLEQLPVGKPPRWRSDTSDPHRGFGARLV